MRLDNVIIRLSAVLGSEWLQAYALIDLQPGVSVDEFRFDLPRRLRYHHETEKYLGGVPGDLFVGFFVKGQVELYEQLGAIRAMAEVRDIRDWAIANFPTNKAELTRLDWRILGALRAGAEQSAAAIGEKLGEDGKVVSARLLHIRGIPLGFSIEPPNNKTWAFGEIHVTFVGTTLKEKMGELAAIGKPFGAATTRSSAALMVEPKSLDALKEMIKKTSMIPGVRVVGYAFCEDMLWTQPWLDAFIEERIRELG